MNPTKTTDTLARLGRWSAYLGGLAGAALSGTLLLAAPPRPFPPAFAPPPPPAVAPTASPIPTKVREGPDLFPPSASPIPTTVREGPDLFPTSATTPQPTPAVAPPVLSIAPSLLSRDDAVRWALQYNPEIAALRQQHGGARSGIVIANTYPFNPTVETRVRGVSGPVSATITNRVDIESNLLWEVELRGQKRLRQEGALATLSRTDNEIAFQELTLAVRAGRAYDTLLYRRQKAALADEAVRLTKEDVERVRLLIKAGNKQVRPPDQIIIQTELNDFIAQANAAHAAVAPAETELRRALGIVDVLEINDTLETPPLHLDAKTLVTLATERRPDRQAHEAAVAEAESRLKLEEANRYGNISVGASFGYDATRVDTMGGIISVPIPAFNRHTGDIRQREAERERAVLELRQTEIDIVHDVEGALARMEAARRWAEMYRTTILPELKSAVEGIEKLFRADDPGVDLLRLIDVHRKLLKARDGYLDAQWELRQAHADLAAALGDPALLAPSLRGLCVPPPH